MAAVYSVVAKNGSTFLFLARTTLHFSKLLLGSTQRMKSSIWQYAWSERTTKQPIRLDIHHLKTV